MITFPNIKINLGLYITDKRPDGYHNLSSVFYPVPWNDILEIVEAEKTELFLSGIPIPGELEDNLCLKAYQLLRNQFDLPPVHIYLHKVIPTGTGLGGGSSDATHTLTLLNHMFSLGLSKAQLTAFALQLGSDCPFFVDNHPAYAEGRGEILNDFPTILHDYFIMIICPKIHISTAEAYQNITPEIPKKSVVEILQQPIATWKDELVNDFEAWAVSQHAILGNLKSKLYEAGASYAAMSGSGSSMFGIFKNEPREIPHLEKDYVVWKGKLS